MASNKKGAISKDINLINKYCSQIQSQISELLAELSVFEAKIDDAEKNIWHGGARSATRYKAMRDNAANSRRFLNVLNTYAMTQTYNAKAAQKVWNDGGYSR